MKNIFEVLDEVRVASSDEERINILRSNDTFALRCVLRASFHPNIRFVIEVPAYKPNEDPIELTGNTLHMEVNRIYLFEENNPRVDPNLTLERRRIILRQILESLYFKEAEVMAKMFKKDLEVPGLTYNIVDQAFPGVLA